MATPIDACISLANPGTRWPANKSDANDITYPSSEEDDNDNDPEDAPEEFIHIPRITTITSSTNSRVLKVAEILFVRELPDFPKTSINGVAYIIDVAGKTRQEIKAIMDGVAYSYAQIGPADKKSTSSFLDDAPVTRSNMKCTGVKACEYLDPEIQNMQHAEVTTEMLQKIEQIRQRNGADSRANDVNSFYHSVLEDFEKQKACHSPVETCKPVCITEASETTVRCINWRPRSKLHHIQPLPMQLRWQSEVVLQRFNTSSPVEEGTCHVVKYNGVRKLRCGYDHPQGQGLLKNYTCRVKFYRLIPVDLELYPYIIWVSFGDHTHPPPAILKTPRDIYGNLFQLIQRINDPCLARNTLLRNPALREFCQQYDGYTLQDIHKSLVNEDKVSALIYRQRILNNPFGQDINAVEYEYRTKHKDRGDDQYIQDFYYDGENLMIICFFKRQIEILIQQRWFQCDMAFKRLEDKDNREVVFTICNEESKKTFTLCRVLVNQENTEMYYRLFTRVFELIEQRFGFVVRWQHIHGEGFSAMVMDMDTKQLPGFGRYLQDVDPERRPVLWQIERTIVFCLKHFERDIERAVGKGSRHPDSPFGQCFDLISVQTCGEYDTLCDELQDPDHYSSAVNAWALHKSTPVIRCGVNLCYSKIDPDVWEEILAHTSACEQTHSKNNSWGRHLSLIRAIHMGLIIDKREIYQLDSYLSHGARYSYRAENSSQRMSRARKRRNSRTEDADSELIPEGTSSGPIRVPLRRRSRLNVRSPSMASSIPGSRSSTPARSQSLLRQSSTNAGLAQTGPGDALHARRQEAEVREIEERAKRARLDNEMIEVELEERRLVLAERRAAMERMYR